MRISLISSAIVETSVEIEFFSEWVSWTEADFISVAWGLLAGEWSAFGFGDEVEAGSGFLDETGAGAGAGAGAGFGRDCLSEDFM